MTFIACLVINDGLVGDALAAAIVAKARKTTAIQIVAPNLT
jgi:hypothetical protein